MLINLSDPQWLAIISTLAGALIGGTFTITKLLLVNRPSKAQPAKSHLSEDQLLILLSIYQEGVTSEIAKRMAMFFYTAQVRKRTVDTARLQALQAELMTLVRVRREQLRAFPLRNERLDEFVSRIYDLQLENDAHKLFNIASGDRPYLERVQQIEEELKRIQLEIRQRIRRHLPNAIHLE